MDSFPGGQNQDLSYIYNPEGRVVRQHQVDQPANLDTTWGYQTQYMTSAGALVPVADAVQGSGNVTVGPRAVADALFYVSDVKQMLGPRGNAAGAPYADYLTTYKRDANIAFAPSVIPSGWLCQSPYSPSANTGSLCEVDQPSYDAGLHPQTVTRYTYDLFGQRLTSTNPNNQTYAYTYFGGADLDYSGYVSAGGWLRRVTDPMGRYVAFATDIAGNQVRTWDRNATAANPNVFPGPRTSPPSSAYSEVQFSIQVDAFGAPWRYPSRVRNPLGNTTGYDVDNNGNVLTIRPPRGYPGNSSFDITQQYDADDHLTQVQMPVERPAGLASIFHYDIYGARDWARDPNGNYTSFAHDSANRLMLTRFTRGPYNALDAPALIPPCVQSQASDAPIPAGRFMCSTATTYDGLDNVTAGTDADGVTTTYTYDGAHRHTSWSLQRTWPSPLTIRQDTVFDPDGNPTDVCAPRFFSEGGTTCTAAAEKAQHSTYDRLDRLATSFYKRDGVPYTTTYTHDADGGVLSIVDANGFTATSHFDVLDQMDQQVHAAGRRGSEADQLGLRPVGRRFEHHQGPQPSNRLQL